VADTWANTLKTELSQGDLISPQPIVSATTPEKLLKRGATQKRNVQTWEETTDWLPQKDGRGHFLASGRKLNAIVLSHDCEIDKDKKVLLVAPVLPISTIDDAHRDIVRNRKRYPFMPVPEIENIIPESYIDLRGICFLERDFINQATRLCSMSETGREDLRFQLIAFITRIPYSQLRIGPSV